MFFWNNLFYFIFSFLFYFVYFDKLIGLACVSGCGDLCAPITVCQAPDEWINNTSVPPGATACPAGRQFCPYAEHCLPLASPCPPGACVNCSGVSPLPAGTQYPDYRLVGEVLISLPAGPPSNILVSLTEWKPAPAPNHNQTGFHLEF